MGIMLFSTLAGKPTEAAFAAHTQAQLLLGLEMARPCLEQGRVKNRQGSLSLISGICSSWESEERDLKFLGLTSPGGS